jgi:hypothetical protein
MRVLRNEHRNYAIEVSRKDKWTTLVLGWCPTIRTKVLNEHVDRDWEPTDLNYIETVKKFLNPKLESSYMDETAERELRKILNDQKQKV